MQLVQGWSSNYFRNDFANIELVVDLVEDLRKMSESDEDSEGDGSEDDSEVLSDSDSSDSDDESIASLERKSMKKDRQFQKIKMVAKHRKKRHIVREKIVSLPLSRLVFINGTTKGQDIRYS